MSYLRAGLFLFCWMLPVICQNCQGVENALNEVLQRLRNVESQQKHDVQIQGEMNEEISGLKEQIANLNQVIVLLQNKDEIDEIGEELSGSYVSFTAYATVSRSYNEGDHVLFDGIIRNYGSSYFVENSTFVCPFDAYYLFSASILSVYNDHMYAQLMLDDEFLLFPLADNSESVRSAASGLTVTYCRAGQIFWIRAHADGLAMHGNNNRHSTLTGTLLRLG